MLRSVDAVGRHDLTCTMSQLAHIQKDKRHNQSSQRHLIKQGYAVHVAGLATANGYSTDIGAAT